MSLAGITPQSQSQPSISQSDVPVAPMGLTGSQPTLNMPLDADIKQEELSSGIPPTALSSMRDLTVADTPLTQAYMAFGVSIATLPATTVAMQPFQQQHHQACVTPATPVYTVRIG